MSYTSTQVIVVGGGLSGCSTAHTVLERGGKVLLLDKNPFLGGNSVKATSGINGALTRTQMKLGIRDSAEKFSEDTSLSATKGKSKEAYALGQVLCDESAPAVEWLINSFGLDLSKVARLGGHSFPRTHRGGERFPGMTITYALMEKLEEIQKKTKGKKAKILTKAKVTKLLTENGAVVGVEYTHQGKSLKAYGPVVLATGGYGADFSKDGILMTHRPDLKNYSTTNGPHTTGDGLKMAKDVGARWDSIDFVQVHPTGLVNPKDPKSKTKFLAAEALRGCGGILLNDDGERFVDELGRRDYVTGEMEKNKGPFRLVLNSKAAKDIEWHCKHYTGRGIMKFMKSGYELAKEMNVSAEKLAETFALYTKQGKAKKDPYGKKFFKNSHYYLDDSFYVAIVTPVVHYCMGGLGVGTDGNILNEKGENIPGLYGAGEIMGDVHGKNRLGGSSLLDCVVFGRVSGRAVTKYLLSSFENSQGLKFGSGKKFALTLNNSENVTTITVDPKTKNLSIGVSWNSSSEQTTETKVVKKVEEKVEEKVVVEEKKTEEKGKKEYTKEEVAKHNTEDDCWVIVNGVVLDVTEFKKEHPGGVESIMLFAGKDASEEFNMLHQADVVEKYAPQVIIGKLAGSNNLISKM